MFHAYSVVDNDVKLLHKSYTLRDVLTVSRNLTQQGVFERAVVTWRDSWRILVIVSKSGVTWCVRSFTRRCNNPFRVRKCLTKLMSVLYRSFDKLKFSIVDHDYSLSIERDLAHEALVLEFGMFDDDLYVLDVYPDYAVPNIRIIATVVREPVTNRVVYTIVPMWVDEAVVTKLLKVLRKYKLISGRDYYRLQHMLYDVQDDCAVYEYLPLVSEFEDPFHRLEVLKEETSFFTP